MSSEASSTSAPVCASFLVGPWVTLGVEGPATAFHALCAAELSPASSGESPDLVVRPAFERHRGDGVTYLGRHGGFDAEGIYLLDRSGERLAVGDGGWAWDGGYVAPADRFEFASGYGTAASLAADPTTAPRSRHSPVLWHATPRFDPWQLLAWVERWARGMAMERGGVWVHGAAVEWQGVGWLFPAWGGAGKTDLLGAALRAGGRYYADDWAAVGQDGQVHPVARRLNLLPDNWRHWPEWRRMAGWRLRAGQLLAGHGCRVAGRVGRRVARVAEGRLRSRLAATALFPHSAPTGPVPLRRLVLLIAGDRPGVHVEPCDAGELIPRVLAFHAVERRMPMDLGALVRFARPGRDDSLRGGARSLESRCLERALAGTTAWVVTAGPGSDPNAVWRRLVSRDG